MSYPTPPEDFDGVAVGMRLILAANHVLELLDYAPSRRAEYLQEAARLLKEAWMAVQTAAGRALKESWQQEPAEAPSETELGLFGGEGYD